MIRLLSTIVGTMYSMLCYAMLVCATFPMYHVYMFHVIDVEYVVCVDTSVLVL